MKWSWNRLTYLFFARYLKTTVWRGQQAEVAQPTMSVNGKHLVCLFWTDLCWETRLVDNWIVARAVESMAPVKFIQADVWVSEIQIIEVQNWASGIQKQFSYADERNDIQDEKQEYADDHVRPWADRSSQLAERVKSL